MEFKKRSGVALITVLLIVTLATIIAVAMTTRQQFDIRRTANVLNNEQAYLYALGGEDWAKQILLRDAAKNKFDHPKEIWALPLPPTIILGGNLQGHIEDLQSRFNLNNLVSNGQVDEENVKYFKRLLTILELPEHLADIIVDWIDTDSNIFLPNGAEDESYLVETPAYRTANTLFRSPSELRLLLGFDQEIYLKLMPYITTLPKNTPLNVNTASQPLIMALPDNGLSESEARNLMIDRYGEPFENTQDFLAHNALVGLNIESSMISVSSDYFLFSAQIDIERNIVNLHSILYRSSDKILTILRSQSDDF